MPRSSSDRDPGQDDRQTEQRVQVFMGEFRILVPALGALLGFQLTSAFSNGWQELDHVQRAADFASVCCTMGALGFLLLPASYHRVNARLDESERFIRFSQRSFTVAFALVGLGLGLSLWLQARRAFPSPLVANAALAGALAFFALLWGVWPVARAARSKDD